MRRPKKSAVAEIVNAYLLKRGIGESWRRWPKEKQRQVFGRMHGMARRLYENCGGDSSDPARQEKALGDAIVSVEKGYWLGL